ncbi:MAG: nitroreductase family protein [Deltaproteobacteria bacterium]|nr:nitroreductase family protein [Deltaproteobacteria bacterium]
MILEEIRSRRAIRRYQSRPVEPEKVEELLEAARLAPSPVDIQPFRALVVDDPEGLGVLRKAAYGWGACLTAPLIFVGSTLKSGSGRPFELPLGEEVAAMNVAVAVDHMTLQAVKLGLGTCWVHVFDREEVRAYFGLPAHMKVVVLLPTGYPAEFPGPRPRLESIRYRAEA